MQIQLSKTPPCKDGYYLMKFNTCTGLHLVKISIETDGRIKIFGDNCLKDSKELYFHEFPEAWWSEEVELTF